MLASGGIEGTVLATGEGEEGSVIGELLLQGDHMATHYWVAGRQVTLCCYASTS